MTSGKRSSPELDQADTESVDSSLSDVQWKYEIDEQRLYAYTTKDLFDFGLPQMPLIHITPADDTSNTTPNPSSIGGTSNGDE
ncbi:hypothetical protein G6F68_021568 [Rhizopus microsporus]|nr:hypothetical protein G6F68_021568 [Rhizopus microsporus]